MRGSLHTIRSTDGTPIAYEEVGSGPPLVLVHGGVCDRTYWAPVVPALAQHFTVFTVDRRGRGASGDVAPYAIEREYDDIAAVVDAIGEPVHLLGHSYAGICALEAALRTPNLRTLTLYEPPFGMNGAIAEEFAVELEALVAAGDRDAAVALMMSEVVGLPPDVLAELRADTAAWQPMVDSVHTMPREARSVMACVFDARRYSAIDVPTVLLTGTLTPPELLRGRRARTRCGRRRARRDHGGSRPRGRYDGPRGADRGARRDAARGGGPMSNDADARSACAVPVDERLMDATVGTLELFGVHLGTRLGLYRALHAHGELSSAELAGVARINERYAREWLEQQAVAGLLITDDPGAPARSRRYRLPAEHAGPLADPDHPAHVAPFADMVIGVAKALDDVVAAYRDSSASTG